MVETMVVEGMVVGGMVVAGGAIMVGVATIMVGVEGLCRTTKAEVRAPRRARVAGSPGMARVGTGEANPSSAGNPPLSLGQPN